MKLAGHNGQNERQEFTEKISEPCTETRRLKKTRKTVAKMGGLSAERRRKGRGRRKVERKRQPEGATKTKVVILRSDK